MLYINEYREYLIKNWKTMTDEEIEHVLSRVSTRHEFNCYKLDLDFIKKFKDYLSLDSYILYQNLPENEMLEIISEIDDLDIDFLVKELLFKEDIPQQLIDTLVMLSELKK